MTIAIVYFSLTGHTKTFVNHLAVAYKGNIEVFELEPREKFNSSEIKAPLNSIPDVSPFDTVLLASPVNGGRMSAPMMSFLEDTKNFSGKKIILLATHFFPAKWGCDQMFQQIQSMVESRGGIITATSEICWTSLFRKKEISDRVQRLLPILDSL